MKTGMLFLAALNSAALASGQVVDQSFEPSNPNLIIGISVGFAAAQSFAVGVSGQMSSFAIEVSGSNLPDLLFWDIRNTLAGVPTASDSATLASGSLMSSALPPDFGTYLTFDVSAFNIPVSAGDVLAITLRGANSTTVATWYGRTDSGYPDGQLFKGVAGSGSTTWSVFGDMDMTFRTSVTAVPEPSIYAALAGAAALAFVVIRRRQAVA